MHMGFLLLKQVYNTFLIITQVLIYYSTVVYNITIRHHSVKQNT